MSVLSPAEIKLTRRRINIESRFQELKFRIHVINSETTIPQFDRIHDDLIKTWNSFKELHSALIDKSSDESLILHENEFRRILRIYNELIEIYDSKRANPPPTVLPPSTEVDATVKLARFDVPSFNNACTLPHPTVLPPSTLTTIEKVDATVKLARFDVLSFNDSCSLPLLSSSTKPKSFTKPHKRVFPSHSSSHKFVICDQNHHILACKTFCQLSLHDKYELLKSKHLCFNCLSANHIPNNCTSSQGCNKYKLSHPMLLHNELNNNLHQPCFSQGNFVTSSDAGKLGLSFSRVYMPCLGPSSTQVIKGQSSLTSGPCFTNVQTFTTGVPLFDTGQLQLFRGDINKSSNKSLQRTDSNPFVPSQIDLLMGIELAFNLFLPDEIVYHGKTYVVKNKLSYVVGGRLPLAIFPKSHKRLKRNFNLVHVHHCEIQLDSLLRNLWGLENLLMSETRSTKEIICEEQFVSNFFRNKHGRNTAAHPFKSNLPYLSSSKFRAQQQLLQIDKQLPSNLPKQKLYAEFMKEYEPLAHMQQVFPKYTTSSDSNHFYLPHHVCGHSNPADCAARGIPPFKLLSHRLWWSGPSWLIDFPFSYTCSHSEHLALVEERPVPVRLITLPPTSWLIKFKQKLKPITAYYLRFINSNPRITDKPSGAFSAEETTRAFHKLVQWTQLIEFPKEVQIYKNNLPLPFFL